MSSYSNIIYSSFKFMHQWLGAYKHQKAPKYRKATKIPESTYKYKSINNIYLNI